MPTNATVLTRLLIEEKSSLFRLARRIVGSVPAAEDVTQALWLRIQRIEDDPPILHKRAYLYRLTANLATDRIRAERRYDALFGPEEAEWDVPMDAPSAERQLLDREQLDRLMRAVDELSPKCREVFILRKLEDMPVKDICERLGIKRSMVSRHLDNALRHLYARMQDPADSSE